MPSDPLPASLRARQPTIDGAGAAALRALVEHADAPRWNHVAGDRLDGDDLAWLQDFRRAIAGAWPRTPPTAAATADGAPPPAPPGLPPPLQAWLATRAPHVAHLRELRRQGVDGATDLTSLPTTSREDLALRLDALVPDDAPLDEVLVYQTAGTTGHPLRVPQHRRSVAAYLALIEHALAAWGVPWQPAKHALAAALVGAQRETVTYPCLLAGWNQATFAKLNLDPAGWPDADAPRRFLDDLRPQLVTSDPWSLTVLARLGCSFAPQAAISTAVAMSPTLRQRLTAALRAPVIDWYSLTETGPIAFLCPAAGRGGPEAMHLLAPDLYVEVIDTSGAPVADGVRGEITVTGGRNPFVPLLRYRTGDFAAMDRTPCPCGHPAPRLLDLLGRAPVAFVGQQGQVVHPVDLARALRPWPLVAHELEQDEQGRCTLRYRPFDEDDGELEAALRQALAALLGPTPGGAPLRLELDPTLATRPGKLTPWRSAVRIEDLLLSEPAPPPSERPSGPP